MIQIHAGSASKNFVATIQQLGVQPPYVYDQDNYLEYMIEELVSWEKFEACYSQGKKVFFDWLRADWARRPLLSKK
jgi:hypothetical protein